ncbi:jg23655, partial [Pararge aegeria aegeria]
GTLDDDGWLPGVLNGLIAALECVVVVLKMPAGIQHINPLPADYRARASFNNEKGLRPKSTTLAQCGLADSTYL